MKKTIFILIFFINSVYIFSQNTDKNIYSGGMLILQPGYIITNNQHQKIENFNLGIGGILRLYFLNNFTTGIYGGSQKTNYNSTGSKNSYFNIGYGGPFLGITKKAEKFRFTFSAYIGFGNTKNLHIENQNNTTLTEAYLHKESVIIISPIISIDYFLTQRLHLTTQVVCLSTNLGKENAIYNPVFQIGILFSR
jgi:hypothetical protein